MLRSLLVWFSCCVVLCVGQTFDGIGRFSDDQDKCPFPNEFFTCGGVCDSVCATLHIENRTTCLPDSPICHPKCYCKDGFARDETSQCIPIEKCGPEKCTEDEDYRCVRPCPGVKTCKNRDKFRSCGSVIQPCKYQCVCKYGLIRDENGACITNEQCDKKKCPGANEYFACNGACDNECATLQKQNKTNCPIGSYFCKPRCYCDDGFARDNEGNCIPIEKCALLTQSSDA